MRKVKRIENHIGIQLRASVKNSIDDERDNVSMVMEGECVIISAPDMKHDLLIGMGNIKHALLYKEADTKAKGSTPKAGDSK